MIYKKVHEWQESGGNVYLLVCQLPCTAKVQKSHAVSTFGQRQAGLIILYTAA